MKIVTTAAIALAVLLPASAAQAQVIELWTQGKTAFGVYAPDENPRPAGAGGPGAARGPGAGGAPRPAPLYTVAGADTLAANPLYDYVFLNLEGAYNPAAVTAMAQGLHGPKAVSRKTLLVRIPPISKDGADAARARVKEIFDAGADGVTIPHIRDLDEAKLALSFFAAAKADIWSPSHRSGTKIAMLMLEDPKAIAQRKDIAELPGLSVLACGIGSLAQALGGDRAGAEAGTQQVLVETQRLKIANMLTANSSDVERRVKEGFLALLMNGPAADEAIRLGRAAAGR
jgi:2-keto-3-deoxy-L-rhamnonate aldolase RhmA